MFATAQSRPAAMDVPPPAQILHVACRKASLPSAVILAKTVFRSALWLKVTMLRRSLGFISSTTNAIASFTSCIFWPFIEPLTSKTQVTSNGARSAAASPLLVAPAESAGSWDNRLTKPKTLYASPLRNDAYSSRVESDKGPVGTVSSSGCGGTSARARASSSAKECCTAWNSSSPPSVLQRKPGPAVVSAPDAWRLGRLCPGEAVRLVCLLGVELLANSFLGKTLVKFPIGCARRDGKNQ
mmetsp:Transcript_77389/g.205427  ORF Transcript_77389/g.205427 Transcript_77389/m.205427 type:complete len:241 (-) Transcript_77389:50-772(-)